MRLAAASATAWSKPVKCRGARPSVGSPRSLKAKFTPKTESRTTAAAALSIGVIPSQRLEAGASVPVSWDRGIEVLERLRTGQGGGGVFQGNQCRGAGQAGGRIGDPDHDGYLEHGGGRSWVRIA